MINSSYVMSDNFLNKTPPYIKENDYHHNKNNISCSKKLFKKLKKHKEVICLAQMQSGKTEVMKRIIYIVKNENEKLKKFGIDIDRSNISVIICASSLGLKEQLKEKLSEIKHKIYHLPEINKYLKDPHEYESILTEMVNCGLVMFDECHSDAEEDSIIDKFRKKLDELAKENGTKYYKIGFSATAYMHVAADYPVVVMNPSADYYGLREMFAKKVPTVFPAKNLSDPNECEALFHEIVVHDLYFIIRLPPKKSEQNLVQKNIENEFRKQKIGFDSNIYDMNEKDNINELYLNHKPSKPVVIYIKDKLRMGENFNTEYVYLVHDDPKNMYAHTTAQSLIGRCCGYNKKTHQTLIYCDYDKAIEHCRWIQHDYNINYLPKKCKYVLKDGAGTTDKCIF